MKVVLIADANEPIAQPFAGGLEAMCWHLTRGLRRRGIDVELYAGPGSDPALDVRTLPVLPFVLSAEARSDVSMTAESSVAAHFAYLDLMMDLRDRRDVDVIHNNSLHYLPLAMAPAMRAPVVTTLHTPPTPWLEPTARRLRRGDVEFVAVSHGTRRAWQPIAPARVIHNGVDGEKWRQGPGGGPLVWFGRIVPEKAPHRAIEIARAAGRRLLLAGPIRDTYYFEDAIRPLLDDRIRYVGHLTTGKLSALVGRASVALVTPDWDEPFGLVAVEAMATGTPAVVFARGGLAELVTSACGIVVHGDDTDECVRAIRAAERLDRSGVRRAALENFSMEQTIDRYVTLYEEIGGAAR